MFKKLAGIRTASLRSTGARDVDVLLGGGMREGSVVLLEQGRRVKCHLAVHKLFIAQGLSAGEAVVHYSRDAPNLQPPAPAPSVSAPNEQASGKIAWRYAKMSSTTHRSSVEDAAYLGPKSAALDFDFKSVHAKSGDVIRCNPALDDLSLLADLESALSSHPLARVSISGMFSPLWGPDPRKMDYFLFELRSLVKHYRACCVVSVPTHLLPGWNYAYFDAVLSLQENPVPALGYDSLLEVVKPYPCMPPGLCRKYGVRYGSRGLRVEKIVIPP